MAKLTTDQKRLFVQGIKWDADDLSTEEAPVGFYDALKSAARARLKETKDGRVLTGSAGNGKTVTFTLPMNGQGMTPADITDALGEILRRYDNARADLVAAGNETPTDEQIYTELLAMLQPLYEATTDMNGMRWR